MKCHTCRRKEAEISLEYSSQQVCRPCFTRIVGRRIAKTVRENKLIEKGDKIAVAISGGKDSCLLLRWLASYAKKRLDISIIAIHVCRGGAYEASLRKACEQMCKEVGVKLHVASFSKDLDVTFRDVVEITKKTGANQCSVCGVFRRRILNSAAKTLGCNKLAIGHNLTDEAQTYLMNFIRGDVNTFSHLGPISLPKRDGFVQRIRPLRDLPEEDIKQYVDMKKWAYLSNPCPYRDGSLRYNMLAVMDALKKARPSVEFSMVRAGDTIRKLATKHNARTLLRKCKKCKNPCSGEVCKVCQLLELK